jgi:hypothetical protein
VENMSERDQAADHLREMDRRIQEQHGEIDRLRKAGQDTARAEQRLSLLRRAMDELRYQLGPLSQTPMDATRPAPRPAADKKK